MARQINNQVDINDENKNSREEDISEIFLVYIKLRLFRRQGFMGHWPELKEV
jgi:hypothetical protein